MKFLYEYRTRDNAVHSGVVSASTRDDAYATLKAGGIKPSRLAEAPGFFNHLFGKGKRWLAIAVLCALCIAVLAAKVGSDRRAARTLHDAQSTLNIFDSTERRYPIGDAAIIENGIRTGWSDVFATEAERFLASFAVPGETPAVTATTEEALLSCLALPAQPTPHNAQGAKHEARSTSHEARDTIESRQILAMVNGLKNELRQYLADGGTVKQYGRRLIRRQREEIDYYQRARFEIETAIQRKVSEGELQSLVDRRNESLRKLGIKPLVLQDFKR